VARSFKLLDNAIDWRNQALGNIIAVVSPLNDEYFQLLAVKETVHPGSIAHSHF
jgi:hypothetical protein